jgi:hypothetical protein
MKSGDFSFANLQSSTLEISCTQPAAHTLGASYAPPAVSNYAPENEITGFVPQI